eukprot:CAMPEP_0183715192 /NCGR_PEP_ID=MMETSP0737-20130205/9527_1 /TAXON_ID=385413 /ORGANISM="Thalassiosira miniscula, Strain CCMP1093" /LENGTH=208 /DNA_ID=CAMNT_0025944281 /DNA_START=238 /DNA_END=864 /DNA_ORIENTATION=-
MTAEEDIEPRKGFFSGQLDSFVGPGATKAELVLQFGASFLIGIGCLLVFHETNPNASCKQNIIVAFIGIDMIGGVVTNSTSAAKRWYHRPGQGFREHMTFITFHALQIGTVAWQYVEGDTEKWLYFGLVYGILLVFSAIVLTVPLYLQRPVAMSLVAAVIPESMSQRMPQTPGLEWFLPLLFLKLLVSHLTIETPFCPSSRWIKEKKM